MDTEDVVIVGAGLFGCTCARILADAGRRVSVLERRDRIGGNCATYYESGIEVHRYGCHIFHTDDDAVWDFAGRFTKFNQYQHHCIAKHGRKKYFLPFNLGMIERFFRGIDGPAHAKKFMAEAIEADVEAMGIDPASPKNLEEQAVSLIGRDLYEVFVRHYTAKQWNRDPKELDASIIRRLPIRYNYNVSYYDDRYQGIPLDGYGRMFGRMLDHSGIRVELGAGYGQDDLENDVKTGKTVIFTGALDELFGYRFGPLPWRSLRFETDTLYVSDYQGNSTMNYVDANVPFTRIHEFKHFHPEDSAVMESGVTVIQREYPDDWAVGKERYYPVNNSESAALYARYAGYAAQKYGNNLIIGGRLGMYRYFDMDDAVKAAMETVVRFLGSKV